MLLLDTSDCSELTPSRWDHKESAVHDRQLSLINSKINPSDYLASESVSARRKR